jgi:hypothetical protein
MSLRPAALCQRDVGLPMELNETDLTWPVLVADGVARISTGRRSALCVDRPGSRLSPNVKSFGRRQAYESLRGPNPRAANGELWGFRLQPHSGLKARPAGSAPMAVSMAMGSNLWGRGRRRSRGGADVGEVVDVDSASRLIAGTAGSALRGGGRPCRVMASCSGSRWHRQAAREAGSSVRRSRR